MIINPGETAFDPGLQPAAAGLTVPEPPGKFPDPTQKPPGNPA